MLSLSCVTLKRILQNTLSVLSKHEQRRLILLAAADVVIGIMDIAVLALLLLLVHAYTQPASALKIPLLTEYGVLPSMVVLLFLFIIKNVVGYLIQKAKYDFVYNAAARISELDLLQYFEGNYHNYVGTDSAVHIRRINQQPVEFGHYVLSGFQQVFSESVMILLTVAAIILYDAKLFLLLCLVLLPPLMLLSFYIKRKLGTVRANIKTSSEQALQHLKEALSGYVESNVYDKKDFLTERYSRKQEMLNRYLAALQSAQASPSRLMETFAVFGLFSLVALNELMRGPGIIPIVTIGAFLAAAYKIIPGIVKIFNATGHIKTYAFTVEGVVSQNVIPNASMQQNIHSVKISNVSFKKVLSNFSLSAKSGEIVGLTGVSGKGKTTLINLLLGFLEPDSGEIIINDQPVSATERRQFWNSMSYVKQQPFLVHDSILTNITLSNQHNDEAVQQAVQAAGLESLGLNTIIFENGKNISGGQRQRIAFARALYKNADLLLLDEPFNELDDASEKKMLQHLQKLQSEGKIVILITHNKSSLSFCTRNVSMDV
jgi:ABC-type multidrug transport system fused ATPase/permease subunit